MTARTAKWAVYHRKLFWLTDTCAGGAWSEAYEEAKWFDSEDEATTELGASEIELDPHELVICRVR